MKVILTTCNYMKGDTIYVPGDVLDIADPEGLDLITKGSARACESDAADRPRQRPAESSRLSNGLATESVDTKEGN